MPSPRVVESCRETPGSTQLGDTHFYALGRGAGRLEGRESGCRRAVRGGSRPMPGEGANDATRRNGAAGRARRGIVLFPGFRFRGFMVFREKVHGNRRKSQEIEQTRRKSREFAPARAGAGSGGFGLRCPRPADRVGVTPGGEIGPGPPAKSGRRCRRRSVGGVAPGGRSRRRGRSGEVEERARRTRGRTGAGWGGVASKVEENREKSRKVGENRTRSQEIERKRRNSASVRS